MKTIEVVAAIIRKGDKIFATQRGYGEWKDWWEFPGGKMEPGETPEEALAREIREELDTEIRVDKFLYPVPPDDALLHVVAGEWLPSSGGARSGPVAGKRGYFFRQLAPGRYHAAPPDY